MLTMDLPTKTGHQRVALVTGAAGIIGPGICSVLRADGWAVAAADRSPEEFELTARFQEPVEAEAYFYADLADGDACERLVAEVEAKLGPIALLVNNAAMPQPKSAPGGITHADYQRLLAVNLMAPYFLTQSALPSLKSARGSVVMISSGLAHAPFEGATLYGVSKAALERQTEYLAFELAASGVRVNGIRVGSVPGAHFMRSTLQDLPEEQARTLHDGVMAAHRTDVAGEGELPLLGRPEDIGHAIRFLASPEARMINGCILPVDGGLFLRDKNLDRLKARSKRTQAVLQACLERIEKEAPAGSAV